MLGGALTDRLGRKGMLIFGLLVSAFINLMLGLVNEIGSVYVGALFIGLFGNTGGPAQQAMVADLLPEEKRAHGFGIFRVMANLAVTIGPAIGGMLAAKSYLLLFICDAVASTITAGIVLLAIRETKPTSHAGTSEQTMTQTFGGYLEVLRDNTFVLFIGACILMTAVYMQMNTTLSVYLRDVHSVSEQGFGYILSLNAAMVVLFQLGVNALSYHQLTYRTGQVIMGFYSALRSPDGIYACRPNGGRTESQYRPRSDIADGVDFDLSIADVLCVRDPIDTQSICTGTTVCSTLSLHATGAVSDDASPATTRV